MYGTYSNHLKTTLIEFQNTEIVILKTFNTLFM